MQNKGGAGKTAVSINVGVGLHLLGQSGLLIDLDPQGSSSLWAKQREGKDPDVIAAQSHQLEDIIKTAEDSGADFMIIDTPPRSDSIALAAARAADIILLPCRPSLADIDALKLTKDIVYLAGKQKQAYVVLNSIPTKRMQADASVAITSMDLEIAQPTFGQRVAFADAFTIGMGVQEYEPSGKAASEVKALVKWLNKKL